MEVLLHQPDVPEASVCLVYGFLARPSLCHQTVGLELQMGGDLLGEVGVRPTPAAEEE
jgi:hypothetical protein